VPTSKLNLNKASACCVADAFALMEESGWWEKLDSASCYNKGAEGPHGKKRKLEWVSAGGIRCYSCTPQPDVLTNSGLKRGRTFGTYM
jgi:hypothetical protein